MIFEVFDRHSGEVLTALEVLEEVNRDRSADWSDFDINDIKNRFDEVLKWLDPEYFDIRCCLN